MPTREPPSCWAVVRRHPRVLTAAAAVVVALALTAALGGWARTVPESVTRVEPGAEVTATPFRFQLDRAEATYEQAGTLAEPGQAYLVISGVLTLDSDEAVGSTTLGEALSIDLPTGYDAFGSPSDEAEAAIRVAADGSMLLGIGPGLSYDVLVTYVVDEADVPDQVTLTLNEHIRRESSLDFTLGWFDPAPVARVTFDVAPLPAERPKEEF